ncbi:MAG: Rossman fold protein, TIGR00730 family [Bacteroidetes bacterium GWF2_49_14]|nr:MAG: Rossman fold protein, TIGR00730 family [Bacteroidetes bacterium GWF2_49_14]
MDNNLIHNRICVYCASSTQTPEKYMEQGRRFSEILAAEKIDLVFGGSRSGLMGVMADRIMELGGRAVGIMPRFMMEVEWHHHSLSELILVETMADRKDLMISNVDAVVTFPGGCGTMEEFMETLSNKRLGTFSKPMIILNSFGFYDPLLQLLDSMIGNRFLRERHREMWTVVSTPEEILPAILSARPWDSEARSFALVQ